nr:hypothetical protein [Rhodothermus marinus]
MIWGYTLPLPSLVDAGLLPVSFIENGPWGVGWLRPYQLFGLEGFDPISHALFWSLLFNAGLYVGVSLFTQQRVEELLQARASWTCFASRDGRARPPGAGPPTCRICNSCCGGFWAKSRRTKRCVRYWRRVGVR